MPKIKFSNHLISYFSSLRRSIDEFTHVQDLSSRPGVTSSSNGFRKADKDSFEIFDEAYVGNGILINSDFLNGLDIKKAQDKIINHLETEKVGKKKINFRLRDWGVSRQRYWGCPIPIIYREDGKILSVPDDQLPIELPDNVDLNQS